MFKLIRDNFFVFLFICSSLAVTVIAIFASVAMNNSAQMVADSTRDQLVALSRAAAMMIDAEDLDGFNEPEDMYEDDYLALKEKLINFTESAGLEYTYYIRFMPETDMQRFIIDNTPIDFTALSEPPIAREPATDLALSGVANAVELGSYSDGWEGYMSAFAPVYHEDGTPSNIIAGVDMIDVYIRREHDNFGRMAVVLSASILIVLAAGILSLIMYQKKAKQSYAASNSKSAFLANMSHEMRTPMNAIIGMTEIARKAEDLTQVKRSLDKIEGAAVHLLGIINDVLDISKIEAGKLMVSIAPFRMDDLLKDVLNVNNFRVKEKHQILNLDVAENVPAAISSDEQRISQVLTNLLSNAVKFTPENGHIDIAVRKLSEADGQCILQFSVKDTGIGMSLEQQAKLFRAFEQADESISRRFGGTGLGLSISKRIVEMLGGDIRVESKENEGSVFTFTIRATIIDGAGLDPVRENARDEAEEPVSFAGRRMLLAEDIEINQEILIALLEDTGIEIDVADNGVAAFAKFSADPSHYDIIFMDIHMPDMDGYATTEKIRAMDDPRAKQIPIIAMTANVFKEDVDRCLASGMNDHLGKPIDVEDMMRKLEHYLAKDKA